MAPLPKNNTAIYKLHYRSNFRNHSVSFRYDDLGTPTPPSVGFLVSLTTILNACASFMPNDWGDQSAEYTPSGATVSIPTGLPLLRVTGTVAALLGQAPGYLDVTGRSVGGRQSRFFLLGAAVNAFSSPPVSTDWRVTAMEDVTVAAIVNALDASAVVAIDNGLPLWKSYMNFGYNAYWQGAVRT